MTDDLTNTLSPSTGYYVGRDPSGGFVVRESTEPWVPYVTGAVHGSQWPTRRDALGAVHRDLNTRLGLALSAGNLPAVKRICRTIMFIADKLHWEEGM